MINNKNNNKKMETINPALKKWILKIDFNILSELFYI